MAAPDAISQLGWGKTFSSCVNTIVQYTPIAAKGVAVSAAVFTLKNVQPINYLYAFPIATVLTAGPYLKGIESRNWKSIYFGMKASRLFSTVAMGGLAFWQFTHLQKNSLDILRVLTGLFCLTTAACTFHDRIGTDKVKDFLSRCTKLNPSKQDLLALFFINCFRLPIAAKPNLISAFVPASELEGLVTPFFERISVTLKTVELSTLAEVENQGEPTDVGDSIAKDIAAILQRLTLFPTELKVTYLDRLLDIFVGQTLPQTILEVFEDQLPIVCGEEMQAKVATTKDMDRFVNLQYRIMQLEKEQKVDMAELETLAQTFKEIAQNAERCELFADQHLKDEEILQPIAENARKEILRITALQAKHRPRNQQQKDTLDLSTGLFEHLYAATGSVAADSKDLTKDLQEKNKQLEAMLLAFFKVPQDKLYETMGDSDISTLQQVLDKGICTRQELNDNALFLKRMKAFFEKKGKKTPGCEPPKKVEQAANARPEANPFVITGLEIVPLSLMFGGYVIGACTKAIFRRFPTFQRVYNRISYPLHKYNTSFPRAISSPNLPLVFRIHVRVTNLFVTTFTLYPFLVAASMGYRIPYLKTVSVVFPLLVGFSSLRR